MTPLHCARCRRLSGDRFCDNCRADRAIERAIWIVLAVVVTALVASGAARMGCQ